MAKRLTRQERGFGNIMRGDYYRSDRFEVGGEGRVVTIRRLTRHEMAKTLMTKLPFSTLRRHDKVSVVPLITIK